MCNPLKIKTSIIIIWSRNATYSGSIRSAILTALFDTAILHDLLNLFSRLLIFVHCKQCRMTKPTKWLARPAKTQIRLSICPVWSEPSLSTWRNIGPIASHWAHGKDSDQTGWMPRLIWVFTGGTGHFVGLVTRLFIWSRSTKNQHRVKNFQWWNVTSPESGVHPCIWQSRVEGLSSFPSLQENCHWRRQSDDQSRHNTAQIWRKHKNTVCKWNIYTW